MTKNYSCCHLPDKGGYAWKILPDCVTVQAFLFDGLVITGSLKFKATFRWIEWKCSRWNRKSEQKIWNIFLNTKIAPKLHNNTIEIIAHWLQEQQLCSHSWHTKITAVAICQIKGGCVKKYYTTFVTLQGEWFELMMWNRDQILHNCCCCYWCYNKEANKSNKKTSRGLGAK